MRFSYHFTQKIKSRTRSEQARLKAEQERLEQAKRLAKQKAQQEADKTEKMWYLAIISIILIGLAVLAVFFIKGKHQPNNNPKSGVEKLKNPSHKN
ncbi:flagellar biosynthesis protein FlgG [Helicobacter pylori]|nr:flagellar biosynthesis protein FlgG [Helicobacter pylori]